MEKILLLKLSDNIRGVVFPRQVPPLLATERTPSCFACTSQGSEDGKNLLNHKSDEFSPWCSSKKGKKTRLLIKKYFFSLTRSRRRELCIIELYGKFCVEIEASYFCRASERAQIFGNLEKYSKAKPVICKFSSYFKVWVDLLKL